MRMIDFEDNLAPDVEPYGVALKTLWIGVLLSQLAWRVNYTSERTPQTSGHRRVHP